MLILYLENGKTAYYETAFLAKNFKHLTGVDTPFKAVDFYKKCLKSDISTKDYDVDKSGTTMLKLDVIMQAMNLEKTARMIGNFNRSGFQLSSDVIIGNLRYSLGFVPEKSNPHYLVPNTLLREDIRKLTIKPNGTIIAMIKKPISEKLYRDVVYLNSKCDWTKLKLPTEALNIMSPEAREQLQIKTSQKSETAKLSTPDMNLDSVPDPVPQPTSFSPKYHLFVNMDGTLAKFKGEFTYFEKAWEPGAFSDLEPYENAVQAIKDIIAKKECDIYVVSVAVSTMCFNEKHEWLDKYLPEIDKSHRLMYPSKYTVSKIAESITQNMVLWDDYDKNLQEWKDAGGTSIKCHNDENGFNEWFGYIVPNYLTSAEISEKLSEIGNNTAFVAEQETSVLAYDDNNNIGLSLV